MKLLFLDSTYRIREVGKAGEILHDWTVSFFEATKENLEQDRYCRYSVDIFRDEALAGSFICRSGANKSTALRFVKRIINKEL